MNDYLISIIEQIPHLVIEAIPFFLIAALAAFGSLYIRDSLDKHFGHDGLRNLIISSLYEVLLFLLTIPLAIRFMDYLDKHF